MQRYRNVIKGSAAELNWLNAMVKKGWLLADVHGSRYDFTPTTTNYRLFTEYVPVDVETTATTNAVFTVLATATLKQPAIKVLYTGTTDPKLLAGIGTVTKDDPLQLKVALGLRNHLWNLVNVWTLGWVVAFTVMLMVLVGIQAPGWAFVVGPIIWLIGVVLGISQIVPIHRQVRQLRRQLQDYDDAWRPTWHIFLYKMPAAPDLTPIEDLGAWRLVGQDHHGTYWYDLQTMGNEATIREALQPLLPPHTEIRILSNLGLWPL